MGCGQGTDLNSCHEGPRRNLSPGCGADKSGRAARARVQQTARRGAAGWAGDLARRGERGGGAGKNADSNFPESGKARIAGECVFWKTTPIGDLEQMSHVEDHDGHHV